MASQVGVSEDFHAIAELKARYCRLLDTKQWEAWRHLFTDDCRFDGTARTYADADEFVADTRMRLGPARTAHHALMPEIVLLADRAARAVWAMCDRIEFESPISEGRSEGSYGFEGRGYYEQEYRQEHGAWRISFLRLTRLQVTALQEPPRPLDGWLSSTGKDWLAGP
jgi:hypothetical protein